MDNQTGGLSSSERQRKTAESIARSQVLKTYGRDNQANLKSAPVQMSVTQKEWQDYHSAWQKYYQKYYSEYYARAARTYVATEKFKAERAKFDEEKLLRRTTSKRKTNANEHAADSNIITARPAVSEEEQDDIRDRLRSHIRKEAVKQAKHAKRNRRLIPIIAGAAVVLVFLFLQYNRLIFAPIAAYVSPGNNEAATITAMDPTISATVSADPKLIIPKLNVDVPVHFGISNDTDTVNAAMNNGVAHYMIPGANAYPGQIGNLVITGHSAGDIYSNNQYKFIFSGLERLNNGDTIYINYDSKRYAYSVTGKETVEPTDMSSLTTPTDKPLLTLVTCTPLGTSRYRLLVRAEQISPAVDGATTTQNAETEHANDMPANEPSMVENVWNFLTGQ